MTAAAAVEPTELEELMKAQAEAAHEREVGDATRPTAEDLAASPTRIDVEGLDLFYGDHHALKDVNIKIRDKQITSFIGPSGCGKSTLLRCFNRMNDGIKDCRIEGKIALDGQDILGDYDICRLRQRVGMVFQQPNPFPMSVYDNVAFAMRVVGASPKAIKKRVPYILGLVGLQHKAKHYPTEMSGGERQRVGLARALVNNPSMIIADEPTGNIDPALSYEIVDLLSAINERGTTVLMVTHEHSLVKHFHKRIIQIHSGEIVADTAAISKEQQAAAQAVATQETVAVDREAIRRAKEARAKADADAQPYATKEFTAPQNNDQANG